MLEWRTVVRAMTRGRLFFGSSALLLVLMLAAPARAAPGDQLWASTHGAKFGGDIAVAVDDDGARVFATGGFAHCYYTYCYDYQTTAYDAATGAELWTKVYNSAGGHQTGGQDVPAAIAVAPNGRRVFVTGYSATDFATVAYRADTGARLWVRRYESKRYEGAVAIGVAPDGRRVYVTGTSKGDFATIAYRATTGAVVWTRRLGHARENDWATALAVAPRGNRVIATGFTSTAEAGNDFTTVAYGARSGRALWVRRFAGAGSSDDRPVGVAIGPGGKEIVLAGTTMAPAGDTAAYLTIAYRADGHASWTRRYGAAEDNDRAAGLAMGPRGAWIAVTGTSHVPGSGTHDDDATVVYDATNGATRWVSRFDQASGVESAAAVATSLDGSKIFVTGWPGTIAYARRAGGQLWASTVWSGADVVAHGTRVFTAGPGGTTVAYATA